MRQVAAYEKLLKEAGVREYQEDVFHAEPNYQFAPPERSQGPMSGSMNDATALAISEASARTLDRVDLQGLLHQRNQPQEWADYEDTPHRATPSMATRRSRSLPAGVHPVQEMGRRKQAQGPAPNPEVFAIHEHDSDEDKEKDHTPNSFSVVSPSHGEL